VKPECDSLDAAAWAEIVCYSICCSISKLEYLAVYGRASMAVFRQLLTYGQKFDRESLYEPI